MGDGCVDVNCVGVCGDCGGGVCWGVEVVFCDDWVCVVCCDEIDEFEVGVVVFWMFFGVVG